MNRTANDRAAMQRVSLRLVGALAASLACAPAHAFDGERIGSAPAALVAKDLERGVDERSPQPDATRAAAPIDPRVAASLQGLERATLLTPDARTALERGLRFLAQAQARYEDGGLPKLEGSQDVTVAVTALGGLAFMAAGSTPERGEWSRETARAIDFLMARADMSGSATHGYISAGASEPTARMHGHGFATMALAQAFAMSPKSARGERLARTLDAAVRRIEASQSVEGGWFYSPTKNIEHENSVTVVQLQALRAARNCGIAVDAAVIRKAVDYIFRCQSEDGSFRYALDPSQKTSIALTAAGLATMQSAGVYEGPQVQRASDALWRRLVARGEGQERAADFPYYERLYVAIALWTMADQRGFERWFTEAADGIVRSQRADGGWGDERYGACYATAMNCLVLSMPDGLLPLFER